MIDGDSGVRSTSDPANGDPLFRAAALRYRQARTENEGFALRIAPSWLERTYRLLLVAALAGVGVLAMAPGNEYASGPAVVRLAERSEVTARTGGTVAEVLVAPGDAVSAGQALGRIDGTHLAAEAEKLRRERELLLAERLRSSRAGAGAGLGTIQEELRVVERALERLVLRAPRSGVIGDVLMRPGRQVEAGQLGFTVVSTSEHGKPLVLGLLPGRYRPLLEPGMPLRLRLGGYRLAGQELAIDHVSASIVGAAELRSIAGQAAVADDSSGTGFVLVRAILPATHFEASGRLYEYYDGLLGRVEVPVRTRRLISLLAPDAERRQ